MKISFFDIQGWEIPIIKKSLKNNTLKFYKEPLTEKTISLAKDSEIISVFIHSKISKEVLHHLQKLKLIITRSTGFDHININECKKRKIQVCNIPSYGENTVAEHTFALIFALSRNVHKSYLRTLRNDFSIEGLKGFDLKGKTIGVIGTGKIGKHVVKIANGLEMKILAFDIYQDKKFASENNFKYVSLSELLKKSDIVTIHIPYTKKNHHLINTSTINKMKKGAILINTSRGGIVDTGALTKALDSKKLSGAGLDVLEGEQLIMEEKQLLYKNMNSESLKELAETHLLLARDNVVFTPHIAFYSQEALERIILTTVDYIKYFLSKKLNKKCGSCIIC